MFDPLEQAIAGSNRSVAQVLRQHGARTSAVGVQRAIHKVTTLVLLTLSISLCRVTVPTLGLGGTTGFAFHKNVGTTCFVLLQYQRW